jgi:hypothetical protein
MRTRIVIALVIGSIGVVSLIIPSLGAADPKPTAGKHRHFILLSSGERIPVGPDLCDNPDPTAGQIQAFSNFHWNVHRGADGLVNELGAEIVSSGC